MTISAADNWAVRQRDEYASHRRFMRDVVFRGLIPLVWKLNVSGLEHIPASGPVILMINHMAAIDPIVVVATVRPRFVVPMSKIENFEMPVVGSLIRFWGAYSVHRERVDREALNTAIALMDAGEMTLIAPEGTRNHGLQRPRDGLAFIATRTDAQIVPTAIFGTEGWPRDLLIPWRRTPVQVRYGPAFRLRRSEQGRTPRDALRTMTDEMLYQLALLLPERYRGDYADLSQLTTDTLDFVEQPATIPLLKETQA